MRRTRVQLIAKRCARFGVGVVTIAAHQRARCMKLGVGNQTSLIQSVGLVTLGEARALESGNSDEARYPRRECAESCSGCRRARTAEDALGCCGCCGRVRRDRPSGGRALVRRTPLLVDLVLLGDCNTGSSPGRGSQQSRCRQYSAPSPTYLIDVFQEGTPALLIPVRQRR